MMVALAVTGVLTVMMLRMFSDSSTIWKTEDDRLDTFREARAALQLMSRDFASAVPLPNATATGISDNFPVLALRDQQARSIAGLPSEYYTSAYVLASAPNSGRGDLCATGYYLQWEPDIGQADESGPSTPAPKSTPAPRNAFALRRQFAESDTTYARLRQTLISNPVAPFFGQKTFDLLYATDAPPAPPGSSLAPAAPVTTTVATYIWDLQFSVSPEPTPVPGSVTSPSSTPAPGRGGFYGTRLPAWVEIRFKALGSSAARKLEGNPGITEEVWSQPSNSLYQRMILPGEQQFVSRVKLAR